MVDDVDAAEPRVLALGARRLTGGDGDSRVYADPAGHPFCLIPLPGWAAPIGGAPDRDDCPGNTRPPPGPAYRGREG